MEFKGTKGNWHLANNDMGYYTSIRNEDNTRKICVSRVNNQVESNANLLLISKAPEMLEMLKMLLSEPRIREAKIASGTNSSLNNTVSMAEQLIKEATEI